MTGDGEEGKKGEGKFVAEGGGIQSNSGSRDTTSPDLLRQEVGDIGVMGGLAAYL